MILLVAMTHTYQLCIHIYTYKNLYQSIYICIVPFFISKMYRYHRGSSNVQSKRINVMAKRAILEDIYMSRIVFIRVDMGLWWWGHRILRWWWWFLITSRRRRRCIGEPTSMSGNKRQYVHCSGKGVWRTQKSRSGIKYGWRHLWWILQERRNISSGIEACHRWWRDRSCCDICQMCSSISRLVTQARCRRHRFQTYVPHFMRDLMPLFLGLTQDLFHRESLVSH